MLTWQATQPNTATTGMLNRVQPIESQMGFIPIPLVTTTSYMFANISNLLTATLGEQVGASN